MAETTAPAQSPAPAPTPDVPATNGAVDFVEFSAIADKLPKISARPSLADYLDKSVLVFPPLSVEKIGRKKDKDMIVAEVQTYNPATKKLVGDRANVEIPKRVLARIKAAFATTGGSRAILVKVSATERGITIK